jgi:hypothetical protein
VSEQQAEQINGEPGSVSAGPAVPTSSDAASQPAAQETLQASLKAAAEVESPDIAPGQGEAKADAAEVEAPRTEIPRAEMPKAESLKAETPKAGAPPIPGKVMIMSSGDRAWDGKADDAKSEANAGMFGKRRVSAMAAVVALAAVAGALGGALATAGVMHFADAGATASNHPVLEASVARIDADILALKAGVEQTSRVGTSQYNKTSDRLDKVEKAQAEPSARLAKLSEAVERLRAAPQVAAAPVAAAPAAAREVTGSITPPAAAAAPVPLPMPKPELARLPTVEGWVLRDVANGVALIEGRQGIFEVYAGDPVPGLGRVDAIRRQDGRWVVVTSKGLVVAR